MVSHGKSSDWWKVLGWNPFQYLFQRMHISGFQLPSFDRFLNQLCPAVSDSMPKAQHLASCWCTNFYKVLTLLILVHTDHTVLQSTKKMQLNTEDKVVIEHKPSHNKQKMLIIFWHSFPQSECPQQKVLIPLHLCSCFLITVKCYIIIVHYSISSLESSFFLNHWINVVFNSK